ncbi:hypothetical protein KKI19_01380 [Patescibacteria group bacterium]|nr:hypothetical protein [Patescibacteria group bacterium]
MKNIKKSQAVSLNQAFIAGADMSTREKEILKNIISQTDFTPKKIIWRSSYWGTSQIGAVHYRGTFKNKPAVLKIQGVKPGVSEIYMIKQFTAQNRSKIIKPPNLLATIPWNDAKHYEALIMECVTGRKVLQSKKLQSRQNIKKFLDYYQEYRKNCLPKNPWLPKPKKIKWEEELQKAILTSKRAYPSHPFRKPTDKKLIEQAASLLEKIYEKVSLEFVHGHFSVEDLAYQDGEVVLFSNLFWKWKYPFCDAVFGYHWFMYELAHVKEIKPTLIEEQREIWLSELFNLPWVKKSPKNKRLAKAALLERAIAGLIIDSFLVDQKRSIAKYLTESTRNQVKTLLAELS